jgi:hypothetical protein
MRTRIVAAAVLLLVLGCARPRPCVIIPMQLDLAKSSRNQVQAQVTTKEEEIKRLSESVEIASRRLDQLRQERDDLKRVMDQQVADSLAAVGRKQ